MSGILLLLYKRNKNKQKLEDVIPTPGSENPERKHEILKVPKNLYGANIVPINVIPTPENERNYNPGQEREVKDGYGVNNVPIYDHRQGTK